MFSVTEHVKDAFINHIHSVYEDVYGQTEPHYAGLIKRVAHIALERISNTDCLYHNVEHTILVSLVGQEILRGKHLQENGINPKDWISVMAGLLCHDIGFVRGICQGDSAGSYVVDQTGETMSLPRGASDAGLFPHHVDRGQIFVRERFTEHSLLDLDTICACIERTRFPPTEGIGVGHDGDLPGLVRAADLIGQLADPMYFRKVGALFHEMEETGLNETFGYSTPADIIDNYPNFFWQTVSPLIQPALTYLKLTEEGKQWVAHLYAHVSAAENGEPVLGPELGGESIPAIDMKN